MQTTTPVKIWDAATRLFHWTLVLGVAFMWWSAEEGGLWMDWHTKVGIFLLALVLFRVIWGFVGSDTSRFTQFVKSPFSALAHLRELPEKTQAFHAGHNPLGALMVVALIVLLLAQTGTGLFATDDILVEGPLYSLVDEETSESLTALHETIFNVLLALVAAHIAAVLFYRFYKNTNLIKAMVTGKADWPAGQAVPTLRFRAVWWALIILAACYGVVAFALSFLAG